MNFEKAIYFDMDGTIANLYGVPNWLPKLHACDPSPYAQAVPMCDLRLMARYLNQLQHRGYVLGVISWLAKEAPSIYEEAVRLRKKRWLAKHLQSVQWNEIHLVKYGTPKHLTARTKRGIIFDDNLEVRERWSRYGGQAFDEKNINQILRELLRQFSFSILILDVVRLTLLRILILESEFFVNDFLFFFSEIVSNPRHYPVIIKECK